MRNVCDLGGHLVDGQRPLSLDPVDYNLPPLPTIGCNRLVCDSCHSPVRNAVGLAFHRWNERVRFADLYECVNLASSPLLFRSECSRLYLCRCNCFAQAVGIRPLDDPDPVGGHNPGVPWSCHGHPLAELPHEFDGVVVTADNLATRVTQALRGDIPPASRVEDRPGGLWVARLHSRLAGTSGAEVVARAAADCLDDVDPRSRGRALHFFLTLNPPVGALRALELLQRSPQLFVGVPDPVTQMKGDLFLEDALWRVLIPLIKKPGRARELAMATALVPGRGSKGLYAALASGHPEWLAEHADEVLRATPALGKELFTVCKYRLPPES